MIGNNPSTSNLWARSSRKTYWVLCAAIVLLATALRLWGVADQPMFFDEGMEYWVATAPLPQLMSTVREGIQDPPFYSVFLHAWMKVSNSLVGLRLPSMIFSVLSVVGAIVLGQRLAGPWAGLLSGLLMALLPPEIRYAQDISQYALMECLVIWSFVALQRSRESRRWRWNILWLLLALASTYTYYGAVLPTLVPFGVSFLGDLRRRDWQDGVRNGMTLALFLAALAPLVVFFLPDQLLRGPTRGALQLSMGSPVAEIRLLVGETQRLLAFLLAGWPWARVPAWLPVILVMAPLTGFLWAARTMERPRQWLWWLLAVWGVYFIVGWIGLYPYRFRYAMVLVPLLIPATGAGFVFLFQQRRLRWISAGALAALLLLLVVSLPNPPIRERFPVPAVNGWTWPEREELPQLLADWQARSIPGQPTYVYYGALPALGYYLQRDQLQAPVPPLWYTQCWNGERRSLPGDDPLICGAWLRGLTPDEQIDAILSAMPAGAAEFWLLFSHIYEDENAQILAGLAAQYDIVDQIAAPGAEAYLLRVKE
jgi:4-amino-4-deoxy-L-arabinose transferase-like glycosyltransferase